MTKILGWSLPGVLLAVAGTAATPQPAAAHVCIDFPLSRVGAECVARSPQKVGPCGVPERTDMINVFHPGQTIEVRLRETVNHPSHYRIGFNPDGDWFPDPDAVDDIDDTKQHILLDGIVDAEEAEQTVEVTLPDIECENCTLQVIQVMYDKQDNGFGGRNAEGGNDDMYYACADIALRQTSASAPTDVSQDRGLPLAGLGLLLSAGVVFGASRKVRK